MSEPVCTRCKVTSCLVWQRDKGGAIICLDCQAAEKSAKTPLPWVPPPHVSAGKAAKATSKQTQQTVNQATPAQSQPEQPTSGVTTRRTTRSHERAKARQQQHQQHQQHSSLTASPSPAPPTAVQSSSGGHDLSKRVESPTPPAVVESTLDIPSPVPSSNGHSTTPATFTSRRSLRQSQSVQAAEHELYTVTSNSMQHQVQQCVWV